MFGLKSDTLWQRYEREKRKRRIWTAVKTTIAFLCIACVASWMYWQNQQTQKANWKMKENQARFVSEKAIALAEAGDSYLARLLLLGVLPENLNHPDYPCVNEAESAFIVVTQYDNAILAGHTSGVNSASFSPDGKRIVSAGDNTIRIWDYPSLQELIDETRERSKNRQLTPEERRKYYLE